MIAGVAFLDLLRIPAIPAISLATIEAFTVAALAAALQSSLVAGALLTVERATRSRWPVLGPGLVALALAKFATPFWLAWPMLPAVPAGALAPMPAGPVALPAGPHVIAGSPGWLVAASIWVLGSLVAFARIVIERRRLARRLVRTSACDDPAVLATLASASRRAGLAASPPLFVSHGENAPFVAGAFAPRIVVPAPWLDRLSPADLETVLLHEAVHVKRRDVLWLELAALLEAWWWWNPLVRVAAARGRAILEDRCDDEVLVRTHGGAEAYGRSLLRAARLALPVRVAAAAGTAGFGAHDVERRLRRMLAQDPAGTRGRQWAVGALAVTALLVLPFLGHAPGAAGRAGGSANATATATSIAAPAGRDVPTPGTESHAARHARLHAQHHTAHARTNPTAP